jgi:hypothetical protein
MLVCRPRSKGRDEELEHDEENNAGHTKIEISAKGLAAKEKL